MRFQASPSVTCSAPREAEAATSSEESTHLDEDVLENAVVDFDVGYAAEALGLRTGANLVGALGMRGRHSGRRSASVPDALPSPTRERLRAPGTKDAGSWQQNRNSAQLRD